jgi:UDP-N-acetyl-D-mannosaminuronic acid transferase (WecB/TagA/CpsF family)
MVTTIVRSDLDIVRNGDTRYWAENGSIHFVANANGEEIAGSLSPSVVRERANGLIAAEEIAVKAAIGKLYRSEVNERIAFCTAMLRLADQAERQRKDMSGGQP